jgi:predicted helicase
MPSMLMPNYGIAVGRAGSAVSKEFMWNLAFVSDKIVDLNLFYRGGANIFPMYLYEDIQQHDSQQKLQLGETESKRENLSPSFRTLIDSKYKKAPSVEQIFGYVYAILHSPTYRTKYKTFLGIDFPKIPFTDDEKTFFSLSKLGWELIDAHLMKNVPSKKAYPFGDFKGKGDFMVERREFIESLKDKTGKIQINKTQYFDNIPSTVYQFYIGGYQVLDKYLKDRKGKKLDLSDVDNIEKIIRVISFTEDTMKQIDELLAEWI